MTVAFWPGEDWSVADGAPEGVRFDITVPSASNPERPYRIVRQETSPGMDGYLIHTPACRAWKAGRRMCSHVQRALETAEDPLRRLAIDIREAWSLVCLSPEAKGEFAAAMVQSAEQAINQADELERYEERLEERRRRRHASPAEKDALADQAIAEFGDRPARSERAVMTFEGRRTVIGGPSR